MEDLSVGQVVLANFPFSDLISFKVRPCLVIGSAEFDDVVVCQITSQRYSSKRALSLDIKDFDSGTIAIDSFIRPDKIAILDKKLIKLVLGVISGKKHAEVKSALQKVFEM